MEKMSVTRMYSNQIAYFVMACFTFGDRGKIAWVSHFGESVAKRSGEASMRSLL